jgi:uncharacterized protein (TIGR02646 family)
MISVKKDYNDIPAILESEEVEIFREAWRTDADVKPKIDKKIYSDKSVADALNEIYQNKCAMCEVKLNGNFAIAHYRPTTLYPWLAYEWSNLLLLCPDCNKAKRESFPISNEKKRISKPPTSFYDWRADSLPLKSEEPGLANPEIHDVARTLEINLDGELSYNRIFYSDSFDVEKTIEIYDLNRIDLLHAREKVINRFITSFQFQLNGYLKNDFTQFNENNFLALTDNFFDTFFGELRLARTPSQEYNFVYKYFYENFNSLISKGIKNKVYKKIIDSLFKIYVNGNRDSYSVMFFYNLLIEFKNVNFLESKENSSTETIIPKLHEIPIGYINSVVINEFLFIKNISLDFLKHKREIYFLGDNGYGKTSLLQGILTAFKGHYIISRTAKETGAATDLIRQSHISYAASDSMGNEYYPFNDQFENSPNYLKNIYAYGVQRRAGKENQDLHGVMTLFDDNFKLIHPLEWLTELDRLEAKDKKPPVSFTVAVKILEELLNHDNNESRSVKITFDEDAKIVFTEHGTHISFNQLSEGYKSIMTCVCDLLSRLAENQPNVTNTKDYQGVVLLDEIDLHLHPKWANTIVNKLTTWFPNIQFFFTTHSPIVLLGASRDAVFYKLYKEDGVIKISQPLESISSLTANTILTSPLFGLEDAISDAFDVDKDDPNTEDHYWDSIIHKEISKRISKNAGVTELDIIKLVNEELDKLEEEAKRDKN